MTPEHCSRARAWTKLALGFRSPEGQVPQEEEEKEEEEEEEEGKRRKRRRKRGGAGGGGGGRRTRRGWRSLSVCAMQDTAAVFTRESITEEGACFSWMNAVFG